MDVIEIHQEDGSVKSTPHHCQGTTECSCHVYRWNYTDVGAYQAVGIPDPMIFTINPKGVVRHELTTEFQTSYGSMA